jgi:hypothetical protein
VTDTTVSARRSIAEWIEALKRLARTLGVSADYLIGMYDKDEDSEQLATAATLIGV